MKTRRLLWVSVVLAVAMLTGCGKKTEVTPKTPDVPDNTSQVEEKPIIDESIVQIVSGEIGTEENQVTFFYMPQLVGDTEDVKKANERIKDIYSDIETKNYALIQQGEKATIPIGFTYGNSHGILSFRIEYELEDGTKQYDCFNFSKETMKTCTNKEIITAWGVSEEELVKNYHLNIETSASYIYTKLAQKNLLEKEGIQSEEELIQKVKEHGTITSLADIKLSVNDEGELLAAVVFNTGNGGPYYEELATISR